MRQLNGCSCLTCRSSTTKQCIERTGWNDEEDFLNSLLAYCTLLIVFPVPWPLQQSPHGRVSKLQFVNHMQPTRACKWIMHSLQTKSVLKKCSNNFNNLCTTVSVWNKMIQGYNIIIINTYFETNFNWNKWNICSPW